MLAARGAAGRPFSTGDKCAVCRRGEKRNVAPKCTAYAAVRHANRGERLIFVVFSILFNFFIEFLTNLYFSVYFILFYWSPSSGSSERGNVH